MFTSDQDKKEKKEEAGNKQKGKAVEKGWSLLFFFFFFFFFLFFWFLVFGSFGLVLFVFVLLIRNPHRLLEDIPDILLTLTNIHVNQLRPFNTEEIQRTLSGNSLGQKGLPCPRRTVEQDTRALP
jgi:hypothetical protein